MKKLGTTLLLAGVLTVIGAAAPAAAASYEPSGSTAVPMIIWPNIR